MNRAFLLSLLIMCLLLLPHVASFGVPVSANPLVIRKVPRDFLTIQGAINASGLGDVILVSNGTYNENIIVNKVVSIVGMNRETTIIDAGGSGSGISVAASGVDIEGFTIKNSGSGPFDAGITVGSGNNRISNNKLLSNGWDGVNFLSTAGNNVITDNVISSNSNYGIGIYGAANNMITDNVISSNLNYGINLVQSGNNVIYHNDFNNTLQIKSDLNNTWDYGGEGNYWSDYRGRDQDSDGIGDTPYPIGSYRDNYPLMGMFTHFDISTKSGTFDVAVISNSTVSDLRFEIGSETGNRIIAYSAEGKDGTFGFSRVRIPTGLMKDPFVVIVGEEIPSKLLSVSNATHTYVYFTYTQSAQAVTILTSDTLHLYNELLAANSQLQEDLNGLNASYFSLLNGNSIVLGNYSRLQESYQALNDSYQTHLQDDANSSRNLQNLTYVIAAIVTIFIITTVYLSKGEHLVPSGKSPFQSNGRAGTTRT